MITDIHVGNSLKNTKGKTSVKLYLDNVIQGHSRVKKQDSWVKLSIQSKTVVITSGFDSPIELSFKEAYCIAKMIGNATGSLHAFKFNYCDQNNNNMEFNIKGIKRLFNTYACIQYDYTKIIVDEMVGLEFAEIISSLKLNSITASECLTIVSAIKNRKI